MFFSHIFSFKIVMHKTSILYLGFSSRLGMRSTNSRSHWQVASYYCRPLLEPFFKLNLCIDSLHYLEHSARRIGLFMSSDKTCFICFNQDGAMLNGIFLKIVDQFIYLGSKISFTENNVTLLIEKTWTAINWLTKSDFFGTIKRELF